MVNREMLEIQNRISHNQPIGTYTPTNKSILKGNNEFATILQEQVKFSKHAVMRLSSRDINLSNEQMKRINDGLKEAEKKGIKDSLVFLDNIALVVNVKQRTVITAVDKQEEQSQIFTNIDGAIIL